MAREVAMRGMRACLEDLGEVSEVVRVVALGWCRSEISEDSVVHPYGGGHDMLGESLAFRRESFQEISEDGAEDEVHAVVLHRRISGAMGNIASEALPSERNGCSLDACHR